MINLFTKLVNIKPEDYLEMTERGNSEQIKEIQSYMVDVEFVIFITL